MQPHAPEPPPNSAAAMGYAFYWKAKNVLAPGLRSAQRAYKEQLLQAVRRSRRWLDLGAGRQFLPDWVWDSPAEYECLLRAAGERLTIGLDLDHAALAAHRGLRHRILASCLEIPLRDDSVDLVTANVVVEHIADPARLLAEVHRVLAPGGTFLIHTPNRLHPAVAAASLFPKRWRASIAGLLDARGDEDIFPTLYRMNTRRKIVALARAAGFGNIECYLLNSVPVTAKLGPPAVLELLLIRALDLPVLENFRIAIIARLDKNK